MASDQMTPWRRLLTLFNIWPKMTSLPPDTAKALQSDTRYTLAEHKINATEKMLDDTIEVVHRRRGADADSRDGHST